MNASTPLASAVADSPLTELRALLAQRFPHVPLTLVPPMAPGRRPTGLAHLDRLLEGGLALGAITELVARQNGSGSVEVIHALLWQAASHRQFLALIDGLGSFDPGPAEPGALRRLLWVRCRQSSEALKAADLLLRDRNFPLLVLDLKLNPEAELRKISSSVWFRYARLLEQNEAAFLAITPRPLIPVAVNRVMVTSHWRGEAFPETRESFLASLRFSLQRTDRASNAPLEPTG